VSASYRYGSGYPLPGYFQGPPNLSPGPADLVLFQLSQYPNRVRLPAYQRLDCRVSDAVTLRHVKVTVYAEIANLLDRTNRRYYYYVVPPFVYSSTVGWYRGSSMPILPTAGFTLEF
jgi:hypothetical protein